MLIIVNSEFTSQLNRDDKHATTESSDLATLNSQALNELVALLAHKRWKLLPAMTK